MDVNAHEQAFPMPQIGDLASQFKSEITRGGEINLPADYKGSRVLLFSHPAYFVPVCTSIFMTFATMEKQFARGNCKLVGLSVDGL